MNKGFNGFYGTNIKISHYGGSHGRKAGELARAYRAVKSVGAHAAELPASVKALLPAAKKEGKATVWGITLNARQVAAMNKGFNGFYARANHRDAKS